MVGGEGGQKNVIALFHVLGHCSYESDFLMIFLLFFIFAGKSPRIQGGDYGK